MIDHRLEAEIGPLIDEQRDRLPALEAIRCLAQVVVESAGRRQPPAVVEIDQHRFALLHGQRPALLGIGQQQILADSPIEERACRIECRDSQAGTFAKLHDRHLCRGYRLAVAVGVDEHPQPVADGAASRLQARQCNLARVRCPGLVRQAKPDRIDRQMRHCQRLLCSLQHAMQCRGLAEPAPVPGGWTTSAAAVSDAFRDWPIANLTTILFPPADLERRLVSRH